ncbi:MAG: ribose transport system permease protein [Gaiellales bacterium]|nr:ribose transport system permease protein [Gaiellales bacterium]
MSKARLQSAAALARQLGRGWQQEVGLVIAIVLIGSYFTSRNSVFLSLQNLGNIAEQSTFLGLLAVAMTFVVVSGQFDLSVGSMFGLSAIAFAVALEAGWNVWLAALAGIAAGAAMGLTNGLLSVLLRVPVIIITLGTLSIYRGTSYWISDGFPVSNFGQSSDLFKFGQGQLIPWPSALDWIPDLVLALAGVGLLGHLLLSRTAFGQHVYALGSNRRAAQLAGVHVNRVQVGALTLLGATAGVAGVLGVAEAGSADPNGGVGYELDVIAAVIIGGAAITGGRGRVLASLLGIWLIGEVRNGLVISGVSLYGQIIVSGVLVLAAVAVDRLITGRGERQASLRLELARGISRLIRRLQRLEPGSRRRRTRPISKEDER